MAIRDTKHQPCTEVENDIGIPEMRRPVEHRKLACCVIRLKGRPDCRLPSRSSSPI